MAQNQETKICKYCGSEIPKSAKVCPNCRKKQKHTVRNIILGIVGIILLFAIVGAFMGGGSSSTSGNTAEDTAEAEPSFYTIGQTATVDDITVTLNSAYQTSEIDYNGVPITPTDANNVYIVTDWTIQNNSDSDATITTESFDVYVDNQSVTTSGSSYMIDGALNSDLSLAAGRETSGKIVYEVPAGWQLFEDEFKPNPFLEDTAKFQITPSEVS